MFKVQRSGELSAYQFDTVTLQWKLLGCNLFFVDNRIDNERLATSTICSVALCIKSSTFVYCEQLDDKKGCRVSVRKLEKGDCVLKYYSSKRVRVCSVRVCSVCACVQCVVCARV